jgi:hypothetical protein
VLPGVTVEASSPALIEKTRSVVTDGTGQYRIEQLRPGTYAVTFGLPGFNTVKRDGLEIAGSFTATINAEMRVGALEETITVTGETPTVDVQSTNRQRVLSQDVMDALPANRTAANMATLIPGVTSSLIDVGGSAGISGGGNLVVHGSRTTDVKMLFNGVSIQTLETGSTVQGVPNMGLFQELVGDTSTISAEQATGGVSLNLIPREGGNTFSGSFIGDFANDTMRGNNFTEELRNRGQCPEWHRQAVGSQPLVRRPNQERSSLVLYVRAVQRRSERVRTVLQQERVQPCWPGRTKPIRVVR